MPDRSHLQRHVGLAIAYDAWQHWQVTGDVEFLRGPCAELVFEIARFFASLAAWDEALGRYRIKGVVGPDEFHDGYPWSSDPGIDDNTYTNVMAAWVIARAAEIASLLESEFVIKKLALDGAEIAFWDRISRELHVPFHEGVISQFEGYERLEPIDLQAYRDPYGNIGRLDLILESEHDAVCRYQVSKQADVLMPGGRRAQRICTCRGAGGHRQAHPAARPALANQRHPAWSRTFRAPVSPARPKVS